MTEKEIENHDYITIDGEIPQENKSFFISRRFKTIMYSLAIVVGIIIYFLIAH